MASPVTKLVTGFLIVVTALLIGAIWRESSRPGPAAPPFPNPNGYEGLLKAARMLEGDADYTTLNEEDLRTALAKNAEALNKAEKSLKQESRVKLDYSPASSAHLAELSCLKQLALVLTAQGRLAEMDHHPCDAAHTYLDIIRLGHQAERGGTIIDSMVGLAVEALGSARLEKLYLQLNAEECREVAVAFDAAESSPESIQAVLAQERAWARRTYGFKGQLTRLLTFRQLKAGEQRWAVKKRAQEIRT